VGDSGREENKIEFTKTMLKKVDEKVDEISLEEIPKLG
jgi:hypothetical protein